MICRPLKFCRWTARSCTKTGTTKSLHHRTEIWRGLQSEMLYRNNPENHQEQPQGRTQQGGGGVVVIGHKYKPQQRQQGQGSPHVVGSKYRPGNGGGNGGNGGGCSRCGGGASSIVEARSNSGSGGFVVVGSSRKRRNHQSFDTESIRGRSLQEQALWSRFSREELRRASLLRVRKVPFF